VRVLLVEDDRLLSEKLKPTLVRAGFVVDIVDNGIDAEFMGDNEPYDAVVLDLGLPKRSGIEVLNNWRAGGNKVPVVVLTARDSWHDRVDGLKAGADDYLGKPFHNEELLARLNAVIRRTKDQASAELEGAGIVLDDERQMAKLPSGTSIELTGTEFRLLRYFMLNPGKILSKSHLMEHVYDYDSDKDSNVIEVYIKRLRHKVGQDLIQTRRGQGYVFGSQH